MAYELGKAIRNCLIEKGERRRVLCVLAGYCNDETGYVWLAHRDLALRAYMPRGRAIRQVRVLAADHALDGLVTVRDDLGRSGEIVCQLKVDRLRPLRPAAGFDLRQPGFVKWAAAVLSPGGKATPGLLQRRALEVDMGMAAGGPET